MRDSNKKFRLRLIRADERRLSNPPLPGVARKPSFGLTLIVTTLHSKHIAQISVFAKPLLWPAIRHNPKLFTGTLWLATSVADVIHAPPLAYGRVQLRLCTRRVV